MAELKKCAHPSCNCPAPEHEKYCSPFCHDAGGLVDIACDCGHPDCAGEIS